MIKQKDIKEFPSILFYDGVGGETMFKNWSNRDWFWLSGCLFFIIVLLLANYYLGWETNLSIIANATSIALAIIAIFLSLKQDSDSKIISDSMQKDIQSLHKEFLRKQSGYNKILDEVQETVGENVEIEEGNDEQKSYSYDELIKYGERIKQETIETFRTEITEKLENELKENLIKYNSKNNSSLLENTIFLNNLDTQKYLRNRNIKKIIQQNKDKTILQIKRLLQKNGYDISLEDLKIILDKIREEDAE